MLTRPYHLLLILEGGVPFDGIPIQELVSIEPVVTSVFVTLATAGILLAVVCIVFNFMFRDRK